MVSFAKMQVAGAVVAAAIIMGSLPASAGKPSDNQVAIKVSDPLSDQGFKDYVTRFNPFNGTDAVVTYSHEQAAAVLSAFGQTSSGGKQSRKEARYNYGSCITGATYVSWFNNCMYDYTAGVRTLNCGQYCSTMKKVNGQYTGRTVTKSKADSCCWYHDIQLDRYKVSAKSPAACWIHREMYNCMKSKGSAWGIDIAYKLTDCLECF